MVLEPNDIQPVAFDLVLQGTVPCVTEEREDRRNITGYRRNADQIRYHQTGVVAGGWVEVDGDRVEVDPQDWIMTRDHSWGVRPGVGDDMQDIAPDPTERHTPRILAVWNPLYFEHPDGSDYAFHQYLLHYEGPGYLHKVAQGGFEYADRPRDAITDIEPQVTFDPRNRRFLGGMFRLTMADGRKRVLEAEPLSDTGFHLGAGHYLRPNGDRGGSWKGEFFIDGSYHADTSTPESVEKLNQFRDCVIRVRDAETGATGWATCRPGSVGRGPRWGCPKRLHPDRRDRRRVMTVRYERDGRVLVVRIEREERRNAIDRETAEGLEEAFDLLDDDDQLSVGVVTGTDRVFSAGTDIRERADLRMPRGGEYGIIRRKRVKPLIAAVEGYAFGGDSRSRWRAIWWSPPGPPSSGYPRRAAAWLPARVRSSVPLVRCRSTWHASC